MVAGPKFTIDDSWTGFDRCKRIASLADCLPEIGSPTKHVLFVSNVSICKKFVSIVRTH